MNTSILSDDKIADAVEKIAELAHEINRAYCNAIGDTSQVPWKDAPDWQRDSSMTGVLYFLRNPNVTPKHCHEQWLEQKRRDGWTYGIVKDEKAKTHPCFLPYSMLPDSQKAKDYLYVASLVQAAKLLGINTPLDFSPQFDVIAGKTGIKTKL